MGLVPRSFDGSGGLLLFGLRGKANPVPRRVPCSVQAFFGGAPGVLTRGALPCCSCVSFLAVARALGWGGVEVSRQVGPRLHRGPGSCLFGKSRVYVCLTLLLCSAALRPPAPAPACALGLLSQVRRVCFVGDVVSAFLESWDPDVVLLVDTVCSHLYPISGLPRFSYISIVFTILQTCLLPEYFCARILQIFISSELSLPTKDVLPCVSDE